MIILRNFCKALFGVLILYSFESGAQSQWVLDKCKDEIEVYTRDEEDSDFKSFKALTMVDAHVDEIIKVLQDADAYIEWYGFTKTSKLLEVRENEQYNYVETIFPWPYRNRDMVYKMSMDTFTDHKTRISLRGLPDYLPENDGIVRMQKAEGYMLLIPCGQQTKITYVFHSEPGANIPAWLANESISELPFRTLSGLKSMLIRKKTSR